MLSYSKKSNETLVGILGQYFDTCDPFDPKVAEQNLVGAVLYPTVGYHLTETQFNAIRKAHSALGCGDIYLAETEWQGEWLKNGVKEISANDSYSNYFSESVPVENALFSEDGCWSVVISHEDHGFLTCTKTFWAKFKEQYPSWKSDKVKFLEYWQSVETDRRIWLEEFLNELNAR